MIHCKKKKSNIYRKIRTSNLPTNYCKIYRNTFIFLQFITVKLTVYCKYFTKSCILFKKIVSCKKYYRFTVKNTAECKIHSIWWAEWMPVFDGKKNHDISQYFLQYIVTFYILHCKNTIIDGNKCKK